MAAPNQHLQHDDHTLIAASPNGSVHRCQGCGALKLRFGNAVLNLHRDDLAPLRSAVSNGCRAGHHGASELEIQLGESGVAVVFDQQELRELDVLLTSVTRELRRATSQWPATANPLGRFPNART